AAGFALAFTGSAAVANGVGDAELKNTEAGDEAQDGPDGAKRVAKYPAVPNDGHRYQKQNGGGQDHRPERRPMDLYRNDPVVSGLAHDPFSEIVHFPDEGVKDA